MNSWFDSSFDTAMGWVSLASLLVALGFVLATLWGIFYLISLPLHRQERARRFLDLVETGLSSGLGIEHTLVSISQSRDPTLGPRFHLLAAHLESGLRLDQALARVPRLLPPQIVAMLQAGTRLGNLRPVLPACRRLLRDGMSQTRGALNYLLLLLVFIAPTMPAVLLLLRVSVFPQFQTIAHELGLTGRTWMDTLMEMSFLIIALHTALWLLLLASVFLYAAGPRLKQWGGGFLRSLADRVAFHVPWKRKRLQRDFAGMLAILLDAGVPERTAVQLAAQCTDNTLVLAAAEKAGQRLERGSSLFDAIQEITRARELRWRLQNARHDRIGFLGALTGWLEGLDARAFQQEQAAAQLLTTGFVLLNGVLVGGVVVAIFSVCIELTNQAVLW